MPDLPLWLALLVVTFCAFRVTRFFVHDSLMGAHLVSQSGFSVRLDRFAYDDEGRDRTFLRGKIGDLLTCVWCLGFHVSWILVCLWFQLAPWELGVKGWIVAFGVAGAAGIANAMMAPPEDE